MSQLPKLVSLVIFHPRREDDGVSRMASLSAQVKATIRCMAD